MLAVAMDRMVVTAVAGVGPVSGSMGRGVGQHSATRLVAVGILMMVGLLPVTGVHVSSNP
jgi:hypothetical protein